MNKYYLLHVIIVIKIIILCVFISLCNASGNIVCQSFDGRTKSIEQYCEQYPSDLLPQYCLYEGLMRIEAIHVNRLNIGGCEPELVLHSIEQFKNVQTLNISHSGYATLNWLHNITSMMQLHRLNASHNGVTFVFQLLKKTTPNVIELDLSYNRLINIGAQTFGVTKKLKSLFLSHNQLKYISFDAFMESEQLSFIDLRMNCFHEIPPLFEYNQQTRKRLLFLTDNPIQRFNYCLLFLMRNTSILVSWENVDVFWRSQECHGKYIQPLRVVLNSDYEGILYSPNGNGELHCNQQSFRNLKQFSVSSSVSTVQSQTESFENIVDLLNAFGPSLVHMDLAGNRIGMFTNITVFEQFDRLETLSLSNTQLMDFDLGTFTNTRLTKLDLSFNRLERIENARLNTEEFMLLKNLIIFNISGNRIANVHDLLNQMQPTIKWIDLSGNYVGPLNENTFSRLSSLRILNLNNCQISNMIDLTPFKMLGNLNVLNLSYNNLRTVNFSILSNLRMLSDFYVAYCQIEDISYATQYLGRSLRKLDISGNCIRSLNAQSFKTLTNLEYLNMSNTNTMVFDSRTFQHHSGLAILDLSYNKLQTIDFRLLSNNVEQLYLSENNLHTIENLNPTNHLRLNSLAITQNNFSCKFLREFASQWRHLKILGDPLEQKHGDRCQSSTQGVKEFLSAFYDTIKFW